MEEIYLSKEKIKEFMPVIKALSEGKAVQWYDDNTDTWVDAYGIDLEESAKSYRIKPEPKYRPFKNADECWTEMQKHQPFGWLKRIGWDQYALLTEMAGPVGCEGARIDNEGFVWERITDQFTFADGTPFGIKEGE